MSALYTIMLAVLAVLAVSGLYVGVTNDAVNFLNAAIGSKVAKMRTILAVASVGSGAVWQPDNRSERIRINKKRLYFIEFPQFGGIGAL